jgi:hypothetical protein
MCGDTIKTVVLPFEINLNNVGSSAALTLPPIPRGIDEIVIQQVNLLSANINPIQKIFFLWTDLSGDNVCSIICDGNSSQTDCNIVIPVAPRPLPSSITFQVNEINVQHNYVATTEPLLISVTLAFKSNRKLLL